MSQCCCMYISRHIEKALRKARETFKAVLVTGPRQVGKSTLLKKAYPEQNYITFDDPILLSETKREPGLFFRNNDTPITLAEVQYISDLFPYIKIECDKDDENGKFALTGSQQYSLMQNVSESLAGRVAILELPGLSLREMQGIEFNKPFIPSEEYLKQRKKYYLPEEDIWSVIHRGAYPALANTDVDWQLFYSSYIKTYIERDINELGHVKNHLKFANFLSIMAARTGQILNYSQVAQQADCSVSTIKEWTSLLEASGIIYLLQPYSNSALSKTIKTPKLYFRDTGLVCFLVKLQSAETARISHMAGAIFETFVVSEILKSFANAGEDYSMHISYYRGRDKLRRKENGEKIAIEAEIDLMIEQDDIIYPIEIKMSANPKLEMVQAFDVIDRIPGKVRGTECIICLYDKLMWLNDNVVAVPVEFI